MSAAAAPKTTAMETKKPKYDARAAMRAYNLALSLKPLAETAVDDRNV